MILHDKKVIFYHVPKVAGVSIEQALLPGNRDYRYFNSDILFGLDKGIMTQHLTYSGMSKYVDSQVMDGYFKFAFFRNTWERLVSAYTYLEKHYTQKHGSFEDCIKKFCEIVQSGEYNEGWHFGKQTDFLYKNKLYGDLAVDFVGRFENIEEDFKIVSEKIGIPATNLKKLNATKPREKPYIEYYTKDLVDLVHKTYESEISYFGYKF